MLKVIRRFVTDTPFGSVRRVRDDRLSAVPIGKVIVSGTVWAASLLPLVDAIANTLGPAINTGFSAGRVLHAEQLYGVLDLGRTWVGNLSSEIRAAAASATGGPTVDVGETLAEAERLDLLLRSAAPTNNAIADGLARLRRAADRVGGAGTRDAATNPLKKLTQLTPEQWKSGWNSPENLRANAFWAAQSAPATSRRIGDTGPTTAVRDALHAVNHARSERERLERSNELARAFWAPA